MKIVKNLTLTQINKAKSKAKNYSLHDGNGLFLYITTQGSKLWRIETCNSSFNNHQEFLSGYLIAENRKATYPDTRESQCSARDVTCLSQQTRVQGMYQTVH